MEAQDEVFFQKQGRFSLLCGMHSINNILGSHEYSQQQLNNICYALSDDFINPHKHIFGGDYDLNVLTVALERKYCTTKWFDRRKGQLKINQKHQGRELVGFLINKFQPGTGLFNAIFRISTRHWMVVRKINQRYYFFDSREQEYKYFQKIDAQKRINELLHQHSQDGRTTEVIEVYRKNQQQNQ